VPTLPRNKWSPKNAGSNEFHLIALDPGGAATGWAHFVLDYRAYSRPENKVLQWLKSWDCGEYLGSEVDMVKSLKARIHAIRRPAYADNVPRTEIVSEAFDLKQTIGGDNLLSPVRINAMVTWVVEEYGLKLAVQNRALRTGTTAERLVQYGFEGRWGKTGRGKDAFSAMQHAVYRMRAIKQDSVKHPWKLSDGIVTNAYWDCACSIGRDPIGRPKCDLIHP
jgi:hypothetical protein